MTNQRPSILAIDQALSPNRFKEVCEFAYESCYSYGETDDDNDKPTGMVCELDPESDEDDEIVSIFESLIYDKFPEIQEYKLYRAYINCFAPRETANFHRDCDEGEDQVTFIFYANKMYTGLNDGGTTEFFLDDKIIAIPPVPNTLLKFTSWVLHRATPLNSEHRFTYALKYCKKDN